LGGNDMVLLEQPRVLLVGGFGTSVTSFGALWHLLDQRLGIRASLQQLEHLAMADLQKYNIVLLPSGEPRVYARLLGKEGAATLRQWIEAGGTLIAVGEASAFVADTATGLSAVRLRQHVLKDLDLYARALELEEKAGQLQADSAALWGARSSREDTVHPSGPAMRDEKQLLALDERGRLFMPRGCIMNVELDEDHWLSYGAGGMVPALVYTSNVFLANDPVRVPARFSSPERLRLSGLLWPEARERWARSAYATREAKGRGQIILFAGEPNFRGSFHGTERLLLNSLLLGPGFGAVQTVPW